MVVIVYFLFFLFLLFVVFFFTIGLSVLKLFRRSKGYNKSQGTDSRRKSTTQANSEQNYHQKVFSKDEGEYVDFEEIK